MFAVQNKFPALTPVSGLPSTLLSSPGEGIARQRRAIIEGLRDSVNEFTEQIEGMKAKDVLELVLITQYFDTLKDIGEKSSTTTVFVPHNPGALGTISKEIRDGIVRG